MTGEGKKKPLDLTAESVATAKAAGAAAAQRAERNLSVKRDLALDLPTCPTLPDGEEKPYGSSIRLRIRDHDQVFAFVFHLFLSFCLWFFLC